MKSFLDYLAEIESKMDHKVVENATAGSTNASCVAAVPTSLGGLGAGFDPVGDYGIYQPVRDIYPKKKRGKDKVTVLRRPNI